MAWIATLWGSGDFPDTQVEIVSIRTECTQCVGPHTHMSEFATIKFPDGTTKEVDHCALIDWSSDWYDTNTGYSGHCDTFSNPRPPHPITGTRYPKGMSPDELQPEIAKRAAKGKGVMGTDGDVRTVNGYILGINGLSKFIRDEDIHDILVESPEDLKARAKAKLAAALTNEELKALGLK